MRGLNKVMLSGFVKSVEFGVTNAREDEACTFTIEVEKTKNWLTKARVNVYGANVDPCKGRLKVGGWVEVEGKLMNRYSPRKEELVLEVRCLDITFVDEEKLDRHDRMD